MKKLKSWKFMVIMSSVVIGLGGLVFIFWDSVRELFD